MRDDLSLFPLRSNPGSAWDPTKIARKIANSLYALVGTGADPEIEEMLEAVGVDGLIAMLTPKIRARMAASRDAASYMPAPMDEWTRPAVPASPDATLPALDAPEAGSLEQDIAELLPSLTAAQQMALAQAIRTEVSKAIAA